MGESGSLVQAAGSAAFLSPEMGEQQSRNVLADRRDQSRGKETARRNKKKGGGIGGKVGHFAKRGLKWWNRLIYQMKFEEVHFSTGKLEAKRFVPILFTSVVATVRLVICEDWLLQT